MEEENAFKFCIANLTFMLYDKKEGNKGAL